jgi:hypothetical protein
VQTTNELPVLRPVAIPTKGLSWFSAMKVWWRSIRDWELMEDYFFTLPDGRTAVIPKGYVFNGASVPRMLRGLISPTGIFLIPALLHDFGYDFDYLWVVEKRDEESGEPLTVTKCAVTYNPSRQKIWDKLFYSVGKQVNGMGWLDNALYLTLRVAGFMAWRKCRKANKADITPSSI